MRKTLTFISTFFILAGFISCNHGDRGTVPEKKFLNLADIDSTVKPGDNFYSYVNGKWIRKTEIPSTEYGVGGFIDLYNRTQGILHHLLDSLSKADHIAGSVEQKVGDLYASGMDSAAIEKLGYEPLKPWLVKISGIHTASDVLKYVTQLHKENLNLLFSLNINPDDKNSHENIACFSQGGLGLPDRDYYFKKDSASLAVIRAYQTYMEKLFGLTGDDPIVAAKKTKLVYDLEKKMAESHRTNVALRDPQSNYHKMLVASLDKQMPVFAWKSILLSLGIGTDSVNLQQPAFYARLNELAKTTNPEVWKAYLQFHTIDAYANFLSSDFLKASFDFNFKALNGQQVK